MAQNILDILSKNIEDKKQYQGTVKIPTSTEQLQKGYEHNQEVQRQLRETEAFERLPQTANPNSRVSFSASENDAENKNFLDKASNFVSRVGANNMQRDIDAVNNGLRPMTGAAKAAQRRGNLANLQESVNTERNSLANPISSAAAGFVSGATSLAEGLARIPSRATLGAAANAQNSLNAVKNGQRPATSAVKAAQRAGKLGEVEQKVQDLTSKGKAQLEREQEVIDKIESVGVGNANVKTLKSWSERVQEDNQAKPTAERILNSAAFEIGRMPIQRGVAKGIGMLANGSQLATIGSSLGTMYNQVYANNFDNAIKQNADIVTAYQYATGQACLEVGTELLGGQPGLYDGLLDVWLGKLGTGMANAGADVLSLSQGLNLDQTAARSLARGTGRLFSSIGQFMSASTTGGKIFNDVIGEVSEELISTALEPFIEHATLNHGQGAVEYAQTEDYLESAVVSTIISLFYQGAAYAKIRGTDAISSNRTGLVYTAPELTENGWQSGVDTEATLNKYAGLSYDEVKALNLDKSTRRNANVEGKLIKAALLGDAAEAALADYEANLESAKTQQANAKTDAERESLGAYIQMMDTLVNGLGTTVDVNGNQTEVKLPPQFWPANIPSWTPNMTAEDVARIEQEMIIPATQAYGFYQMDNAFRNMPILTNAVNRDFPQMQVSPLMVLDSAAYEYEDKVKIANDINKQLANSGLTQDAWNALLAGKVDGMELAIEASLAGKAESFYGANVSDALRNLVEVDSTGNTLGTVPVIDKTNGTLKGYYDFNRFKTEFCKGLSDSESRRMFTLARTRNAAKAARRVVSDTAAVLEGSGINAAEMNADEITLHPNRVSSFDSKSGTVFFNPNVVTNRTAASISSSHELTHYFFANGKGDQITKYVNDTMAKVGLKFGDWADRVRNSEEYSGKPESEIQEEVCARFMSIMMSSPDIIAQFGKEAPDVAKEMADAVSTLADATVREGETAAENPVTAEQKQIAAELRSAANGTLVQKETESAKQAGKEPKVKDTTITELTRTWTEWTPVKSTKAAYKGAQMRLDTLNNQLEIKLPPNSTAKKKAIRRGGQGSKDAATIFYDGDVDSEGWMHYYSLNKSGVRVNGDEWWTNFGGGAIDSTTLNVVQETVSERAKAVAAENKTAKAETVAKEEEGNPIPAKKDVTLNNDIPSTPDGAPEAGAVEVADDVIPAKADTAEKKLPAGFEKETTKEKRVKKPRVKNGRITPDQTITAENVPELAGYRVVYDRDNDELRLRFPSGVKSFPTELKTDLLPTLGFRPIKFMKEFEVVNEKTGKTEKVTKLVNSTTWHCTRNVAETFKKLTGSELTQELIDSAKPASDWAAANNKSMTAKENALLDELAEDMETDAGIPFPGQSNLSLHMAGNYTSHNGKVYGSIEARTEDGKAYTPDEIVFLRANGFTPVSRAFYDKNGKLTKTRVFQHFMDSELLSAAQSGNADLFAVSEQTKSRPVLAEYPFMGDAGTTWSFYNGEMILHPKKGTGLWTALVNTDFDPNSLGNYAKPYGTYFKFDNALGFKALHAPFTPSLASYAGGISDVRTLLLNNRVAETSKLKRAEAGWVSSETNPDYVFRVMGKGNNRFVLAQDRDTGEYIRPAKGLSFEAQWKSAFGEDLVEPTYYDQTSYVETKEVSLADFGYGKNGRSTFLIDTDDGVEVIRTGDFMGLKKMGGSASFWNAADDVVIPSKDWKGGNANAQFESDANATRGGQKFFDDYVRDPSVKAIYSADGSTLFSRDADYSSGTAGPGTIAVNFQGVKGTVIYPTILFNELVNNAYGRTDVEKVVNSKGKTIFDRNKLDALSLSEGQLARLWRKGSIEITNAEGKKESLNLSDYVDTKLLEDSADRYAREIEQWIAPRENRQPNVMNTGVFFADGATGGDRATRSEIGKKVGSVYSSLDNAEADYYDSLALNYAAEEADAEEQAAGLGAFKEERDSAPQRLTDVNSYPDLNQVSCSYVYDTNEIKLTADAPLNDILDASTLAMLGENGFTIDGNTARAKYDTEVWEHVFNLKPIARNSAAMMQKAFDEQEEKRGGRSRIIPIQAGVAGSDTQSYLAELQQGGVGAYINYGDNTMHLVLYGEDNAKVDLAEALSNDTVSALRDLGFKFTEEGAYAPYDADAWKTHLLLPELGGAKQEDFTRTYNLKDPESLKAAGISASEVARIEGIFEKPKTGVQSKTAEPVKPTGKKSKDFVGKQSVVEEVFAPKTPSTSQVAIETRDELRQRLAAQLTELENTNPEAFDAFENMLKTMSPEEMSAIPDTATAADLAALASESTQARTAEGTREAVRDSLGQTVPDTVAAKLTDSRATTPDGRLQKYVTDVALVQQNRKVIANVGTAYVLAEAVGDETTGTTGYLNLTNPLRVGADRATTLFEGDYEDFLSICEKVAAKYGGQSVVREDMDAYYFGTESSDNAALFAKLEAEGKLTEQFKAFMAASNSRTNAHTVLADVIAEYADAAGLTYGTNTGAFFQDVVTELGYDGVITDGTAYIYAPSRFVSVGGDKAFTFEGDTIDAESLVAQYMQSRGSASSATPLEQTNAQVGRNSVAQMAMTPNQSEGARLRSITKFIRSDESPFTEELKARTDAAIANGVGMYEPETDAAARAYAEEKMKHGLIDSYANWASRLEDNSLFNIKNAKKDTVWTWALVEGFAKQYEEMSNAGATTEELAPIYEAYSTTSAVHAMMLTTAGQVEQSATMIQRLDAPSTVEFVKRWLDQKDQEFSKSNRYRKSGKHLALTEEQRQALLDAGLDVEARSKVLVDIAESAAKNAPRSMWKAFNAFRYTAMLCSPVTWVRNIGGNIVQGFNTRLKNEVAGLMEDVFTPKKANEERDRTMFRGVDKKGIAEFASKYVEQPAVVMLLRGGGGKYSKSVAKTVINSELDMAYDNAHTDLLLRHGPAAAVESLTNAVLEGCDVVALKKNFKHAFRMHANAKGYTAEFLSNPLNQKALDEVTAYAVNQAKEATFRGSTELGKHLTGLKMSHPIMQIVLGGYIPFVNIPINVGKAAVKYSPASFATAVADFAKAATNHQEATQRINSAFESLASGLIGSGLWLLGYALTKNGAFGIKLHTKDDKEDKDLYDQSLGVQHYSILFRDGSTYTMDWLTPVSMGIFAGAEAYNMLSEMADVTGEDVDDSTLADYAVDLATRMLDPLAEMSFLSSVSDFAEDVTYVKNGTDAINLAAGNFINQFAPTSVSKLRTLLGDTQVRSTMAPTDSDFSTETAIKDLTGLDVDLGQLNKHWGASGERQYRKFINKLPTSIASHNAPSYDYWGNPKQSADSTFERVAESLFSPGYYSSNKATELDENILDIFEESGNKGILPKVPGKQFSSNGESYTFSNAEYGEINRISGQKSEQALTEAYDSPLWSKLSTAQKAKVTTAIEDYGMLIAKDDFLFRKGKTDSSIKEDIQTVKDARATGLSTGEYYILKELMDHSNLTPDKTKSGGNSWKRPVISALRSYDLSDEQILILTGYKDLSY